MWRFLRLLPSYLFGVSVPKPAFAGHRRALSLSACCFNEMALESIFDDFGHLGIFYLSAE